MEGCPCFCEGILMRELSRNKQKMWYSLLGEPKPIYAKDDDGNVLYDTMPDGNQVPREIGKTNGYEEPVEFYANIRGTGGSADAMPFGLDLSNYAAVISTPKGKYPIRESTLIWYQNEPRMANDEVDQSSADYKVVRVPPVLDEMLYLCEGIT